jgi:5-methylcytosine-specific restriction endonuclease McrA
MTRANDFSDTTKREALGRQRFRCASCGAAISQLGDAARETHRFGESAQAHHVTHAKHAGSASVDHCVVLCGSCHYCAHEGGNYRFGRVEGTERDFPYFHG